MQSFEDIYEFKEPEPFEFEIRKISDDKTKKRLGPRVIDGIEELPKKKRSITKLPSKIEQNESPNSNSRLT